MANNKIRKNGSADIVGWRLDLVRHHLMWKGAQYLSAKQELFALIAKATLAIEPIKVVIHTDITTYQDFYSKWLHQEGVHESSLKGLIDFAIYLTKEPYEYTPVLDENRVPEGPENYRQIFLSEWLDSVDSSIDKLLTDTPNLAPEHYPDWLYQHQQSQSDCIMAIWSPE